jgi:catechol 2,3-dioxygenase-like lactoylglutathione lyase family enzyme
MTQTRPEDAPAVLPFLQNGVAQIALVVADLDGAVEYYWHTFGIGPWHFYTYQRPLVKAMTYQGQPADYAMRIALTHAGPTRLELIEVVSGDSVYTDFIREHGYGIQHLGVLVEDMAAALEQAREAGFTVTMDGSGFGPDGDGHYAYLDTGEKLGFMLELIQRPQRRHPPEKIYPPE